MEKNILKTKTAQFTFHMLAYYVVWSICIYSAANGYIWFGLAVALAVTTLQFVWQVILQRQITHLLSFLIYLTVIGFIGDSILIFVNVVAFSANPFSFPFSPPFMIGIWLNFAMLFYALMSWFITRPILLAVFAFVGFIIAYLLGATIGAAVLTYGTWSLITIGTLWTCMLPISIMIFDRFIGLPKAPI